MTVFGSLDCDVDPLDVSACEEELFLDFRQSGCIVDAEVDAEDRGQPGHLQAYGRTAGKTKTKNSTYEKKHKKNITNL